MLSGSYQKRSSWRDSTLRNVGWRMRTGRPARVILAYVGGEKRPRPALLTAATRNSYHVPGSRPRTVHAILTLSSRDFHRTNRGSSTCSRLKTSLMPNEPFAFARRVTTKCVITWPWLTGSRHSRLIEMYVGPKARGRPGGSGGTGTIAHLNRRSSSPTVYRCTPSCEKVDALM